MLASESPVFYAMFHHPFEEQRTNTVRYCEMDKDVLEHLLGYVYKKTIEDNPDRQGLTFIMISRVIMDFHITDEK